VLDALASNIDGFLQEIHLFLQFSWWGLFGAKLAFLQLENYDLQEVYLSTSNSVMPGKQCVEAADSNTDGCLSTHTCVCTSQLNRPICRKQLNSILKYLTCWKNSFQNLIQFSQGINVLDAPASITHGFLWRDTGISSPELNRCNCKKEPFSTSKILIDRKNVSQKVTQLSEGTMR
jgi:hypothetical protein